MLVSCSRCKRERPADSCWCIVGGGERHYECREGCILTSDRVAAVVRRVEGRRQQITRVEPVREERTSTLEKIMGRLTKVLESKTSNHRSV